MNDLQMSRDLTTFDEAALKGLVNDSIEVFEAGANAGMDDPLPLLRKLRESGRNTCGL